MPQSFTFEEAAGNAPQTPPQSAGRSFTFEQAMNTPNPSPDFIARVKEDLSKRLLQQGRETAKRTVAGEQTQTEQYLQNIGQGLGAGGDIAGEGIKSAATYAGEVANYYSPETTAAVKQGAKEIGTKIAGSEIGQAAGDKIKQFNEWAQKHPRAAADLGAVVTIAPTIPANKAMKMLPEMTEGPGIVGKVARKIDESVENKRNDFVSDLISPQETKAVREAQVGRTSEEGFLKSKVVEPTQREKDIAAEVAKIGEVKSGKTLQGNYTAIQEEVGKEAENLKSTLESKNIKISVPEFFNELDKTAASFAENPTLVGSSETSAKRLIDKMKKIVSDQPQTAAGLLQARKDLDSWVKSQKGKAAFDPKTENALSVAFRDIRQTTNDFIDRSAADVGVKDSLRKQNLLYNALENITPKAAQEAPNRILRTKEAITNLLPKSDLGKVLATGLGVAGVGGAALVAPVATGVATAAAMTGYGAKKIIDSPTMRKALAAGLNMTDKVIRVATPAGGYKDISLKEVFNLPANEANQILNEIKLLPPPEKAAVSAEKIMNKENILDAQKNKSPMIGEETLKAKVLKDNPLARNDKNLLAKLMDEARKQEAAKIRKTKMSGVPSQYKDRFTNE